MKRYVVDASVAVKWLISEDYSVQALKLLEDWVEGRMELHAPSLLRLEVASALTKYVERRIMTAEKAVEGFKIFREVALTYDDEDWQLLEEALNIAMNMNLSVYDAIYLVLAKKLDAALITADERLIEKIEEEIKVENVKDL